MQGLDPLGPHAPDAAASALRTAARRQLLAKGFPTRGQGAWACTTVSDALTRITATPSGMEADRRSVKSADSSGQSQITRSQVSEAALAKSVAMVAEQA